MKKFAEPDVKVTVFYMEDIITTSFPDISDEPDPGDNGTPIG